MQGRGRSRDRRATTPGSFQVPRPTRRELLRGGLAGAGALARAPLLAACQPVERRIALGSPAWWSLRAENEGTLDFANWPYYIDRHKRHRPSLEQFGREMSIDVNYYRPIKDR